MATMLIKHKHFLLSLLLLMLLAFSATNAMPVAEVYHFCKETADLTFCLESIGTDKRIVAARNLNDVLLLVIAQCRSLVTDAAKEINRVRKKFGGPVGKGRILFCERNYKFASDLFQKASVQGQHKVQAYQAYLSVHGGSNFMRDCENEWKINGPIQKSPVTYFNNHVVKLTTIARKIVDKLHPS